MFHVVFNIRNKVYLDDDHEHMAKLNKEKHKDTHLALETKTGLFVAWGTELGIPK